MSCPSARRPSARRKAKQRERQSEKHGDALELLKSELTQGSDLKNLVQAPTPEERDACVQRFMARRGTSDPKDRPVDCAVCDQVIFPTSDKHEVVGVQDFVGLGVEELFRGVGRLAEPHLDGIRAVEQLDELHRHDWTGAQLQVSLSEFPCNLWRLPVRVGTKVLKDFDGTDFEGEVVRVCDGADDSDSDAPPLYHVKYTDGDEEDFELADVQAVAARWLSAQKPLSRVVEGEVLRKRKYRLGGSRSLRHEAYEVRFGEPINDTYQRLSVAYIVRRLAKCMDRDSEEHGHSLQPEHPLRAEYLDLLRRQYDVTDETTNPESARILAPLAAGSDTDRQTHSRLSCLLLSPGGVTTKPANPLNPRSKKTTPALCVCEKCSCALRHGRLPQLALANKHVIGFWPEAIAQHKPSDMEFALNQAAHQYNFLCTYMREKRRTRGKPSSGRLVSNWHLKREPGGRWASQMRKKKHRVQAMRGHMHMRRLDSAIVAESLPLDITDVPLRVLIDHKATDDQKRDMRAYAAVRGPVVSEIATFVLGNNHLPAYKNLSQRPPPDTDTDMPSTIVQEGPSIDSSSDEEEHGNAQKSHGSGDVASCPACPQRLSKPDGNGSDGDGENGDCRQVNAVSGAAAASELRSDTSVVFTTSTMSVDSVNSIDNVISVLADAEEHLKQRGTHAKKNAKHDKERRFVVHPDNAFLNERDGDYLTTSFLQCFPWGRGGPGEQRTIRCSIETCLGRCLRLRRHPQFKRPQFILAAWSLIARRKASSKMRWVGRFASRHGPSKTEAYAKVNVEQLKAIREHWCACRKADKQGRRRPAPPAHLEQYGVNHDFMRTVKTCTSEMQHSNDRKDIARIEAHSMNYWLGKATFFLTINPNDGCCVDVVRLSDPSCSGEIMPERAFRYDLLGRFPGAAALAFDRLTKLVFEELLCWDFDKGTARWDPNANGGDGGFMKGIFGELIGFYGPFEEQGRFSLHGHYLLWIRHADQIADRLKYIPPPHSDDTAADTTTTATISTEVETKNGGEQTQQEQQSTQADALTSENERLQQLSQVIGSAICADLKLPPELVTAMYTCPKCEEKDCWVAVENLQEFRKCKHQRWNAAKTVRCKNPKCNHEAVPLHVLKTNIDAEWARLVEDNSNNSNEPDAFVRRVDDLARSPPVQCQLRLDNWRTRHRGAGAAHPPPPSADSDEPIEYKLSDAAVLSGVYYHALLRIDPRSEKATHGMVLVAAALIVDCNMHDDKHRFTCSKSAKARRTGCCRFDMPKPPFDHTRVSRHEHKAQGSFSDDSDDPEAGDIDENMRYSLNVARSVLCMWLVQHNAAVSVACCCNNNVRYVINASVSMYLALYSSKRTHENKESMDWCISNVARKLKQLDDESESGIAMTPFSKGLRLLSAAWYGRTQCEEVGGQLAALFLLGRGSHMHSHDFASCGVGHLISILTGKSTVGMIGRKGSVVAHVLDYLHRPDSCEHLSIMHFVAEWERVSLTVAGAEPFKDRKLDEVGESDENKEPDDEMPRQHPATTKGVRKRNRLACPLIRHSRLPSYDAIRHNAESLLDLSPSDRDKAYTAREKYGEAASALTTPCRRLKDLLHDEPDEIDENTGNGPWWRAWQRNLNQLQQQAASVDNAEESNERQKRALRSLRFLKHQQEYHHEKAASTVVDFTADPRGQMVPAGDEANPHDSDFHESDIDMEALDQHIEELESMQSKVVSDEADSHGPLVIQEATPFRALTSDDIDALRDDSNPRITPVSRYSEVPLVTDVYANTHERKISDARTFVEEIKDCLAAHPTRNSPEAKATTPASFKNFDTRTIDGVAKEKRLNAKQRVAFRLCAAVWMRDMLPVWGVPEADMKMLRPLLTGLPDEPLRMMLTGEGGTGKSRVVKAFVEFVQRWGGAATVCVTATSGVAACLIGGTTWQKATGSFVFDRNQKRTKPKVPAVASSGVWKEIRFVVIDEVSMLSAQGIAKISSYMQKLKGDKGLFGSVNLLFVGDFYQLPPVRQAPLYNNGELGNAAGRTMEGRELWLSELNAAIILTENYRARNDPGFQEFLRLLRLGKIRRSSAAATVLESYFTYPPLEKVNPKILQAAWRELNDKGIQRAKKHATATTPDSKVASRSTHTTLGLFFMPIRPGVIGLLDREHPSFVSEKVTTTVSTIGGFLAGEDLYHLLVCSREAHSRCEKTIAQLRRTVPMCIFHPQIITPTNNMRAALNTRRFREHTNAVFEKLGAPSFTSKNIRPCAWRQRGCLIIDAVFHTTSKQLNYPPFDSDWQRRLRSCAHEHRTFKNKYAPALQLVLGHRYMLTQNIQVSQKLANGVPITPMDVKIKPNAKLAWDPKMQCHRVPADQVGCIVFKHLSKEWKSLQLHPHLPRGHHLINPCTPTECANFNAPTFCVRLLHGKTRSARITQFPMISATAISGHKSQGMTLHQIAIAGACKAKHMGVELDCFDSRNWSLPNVEFPFVPTERGWWYTAMSRTTSRITMCLMTPRLPWERFCTPRYDIAAEMARLAVLDAKTRKAMLVKPSRRTANQANDEIKEAEAKATRARKRFQVRKKSTKKRKPNHRANQQRSNKKRKPGTNSQKSPSKRSNKRKRRPTETAAQQLRRLLTSPPNGHMGLTADDWRRFAKSQFINDAGIAAHIEIQQRHSAYKNLRGRSLTMPPQIFTKLVQYRPQWIENSLEFSARCIAKCKKGMVLRCVGVGAFEIESVDACTRTVSVRSAHGVTAENGVAAQSNRSTVQQCSLQNDYGTAAIAQDRALKTAVTKHGPIYIHGYSGITEQEDEAHRNEITRSFRSTMQSHGIMPADFFENGISLQFACNIYNGHWSAIQVKIQQPRKITVYDSKPDFVGTAYAMGSP